MNQSLKPAFEQVVEQCHPSYRERMAIRLIMVLPRKRKIFEEALTELAIQSGAMPLEASVDSDGCYVGDWQDFLDFLIANLPAILELIAQLLPLIFLFL